MLSTEDLKSIEVVVRRVVREELAAAKRSEDLMGDEAYLVVTTTPQERNRMFHANRRAAKVATQKGTGQPLAQMPILDQIAARNREIKLQHLAEKRAKRVTKEKGRVSPAFDIAMPC